MNRFEARIGLVNRLNRQRRGQFFDTHRQKKVEQPMPNEVQDQSLRVVQQDIKTEK